MENKRKTYIFYAIVLTVSSPVWIGLGIMLTSLQRAGGPERLLVVGVGMIALGAISFLAGIFLWWRANELKKALKEQAFASGQPPASTILGMARERENVDLLPVPPGVRVQKDPAGLQIDYKGKRPLGVWLGLGLALLSFCGGGLELLLEWNWIVAITFLVGGLFLGYICLAALVNHRIIRVTHQELRTRSRPLPLSIPRNIACTLLKQLYVKVDSYQSQTGMVTTYALSAILQDERQVRLVSPLPPEVARYLEVQIESWLGITDRVVIGEATRSSTSGT